MSRKRKQVIVKPANSSTGSDNGTSSPNEKKARETSSSGSVFDSLTDETLDTAEMTKFGGESRQNA